MAAVIDLPAAVRDMAARGPQWADWVDDLPRAAAGQLSEWGLRVDGAPAWGGSSLVLPVRTGDGEHAVLKLAFPQDEVTFEHLALRRWAGTAAVRLLRADPHRRALLLERAHPTDLRDSWDIEACEIVAALYPRLHLSPMPQLPNLSDLVARWVADLGALPRSAPIPHRLVEQAIALGRAFATDGATSSTLVHGNLHYRTVLAGDREPWLAISPRPVNGDPHYEIAPMLWHRWDELAGYTRDGVRRRFHALVDAAGLSDERARDWVVVRMACHAMWALRGGSTDTAWLTTCIAVAKAVQD
ncbi:aminoglycoside phosphotransferase family protein [Mycolicibacterium sp. GCM10028919]|uniref:aminoglycoside phosphotransferase family protein n=1 Tax=Mycolicibacterium sp. GCM10028919 TaxID=3273401 RepID=UPI003610E92D